MLTYRVKQGETLASIAADFRIDQAALVRANPSLQTGILLAGQIIVIPGIPNP
nr:LysM domain-containing protein [Bacillus pacificus]